MSCEVVLDNQAKKPTLPLRNAGLGHAYSELYSCNSPDSSSKQRRSNRSSRKNIMIFLLLLLVLVQDIAWRFYVVSIQKDNCLNVVNDSTLIEKYNWFNSMFARGSSQIDLGEFETVAVSPYPPLSCEVMLNYVQERSNFEEVKARQDNATAAAKPIVSDTNAGVGHFRLTTTNHTSMKGIRPFWVSLHEREVDHVRWGIMTYGYYYETKLTEAIRVTLNEYSPSNALFVDVGGNIGWFSLVARSLGYEVAVFEPNPINQLRLCQSLQFNGWLETQAPAKAQRWSGPPVNVYPYGVGDLHGTQLILKQQDHRNPGAGTLRHDVVSKKQKAPHNQDQTVSVVSLDEMAIQNGWIDSKDGHALPGAKVIAFMKVDVEGFESHVFRGAQKLLLQSKLVKNVEIEWNGEKYIDQKTGLFILNEKNKALYDIDPVVQLTQNNSYNLYRMGGWMGPNVKDTSNIPPTNDRLVKLLAEQFHQTKKGTKTRNLWFRLREDGNGKMSPNASRKEP